MKRIIIAFSIALCSFSSFAETPLITAPINVESLERVARSDSEKAFAYYFLYLMGSLQTLYAMEVRSCPEKNYSSLDVQLFAQAAATETMVLAGEGKLRKAFGPYTFLADITPKLALLNPVCKTY